MKRLLLMLSFITYQLSICHIVAQIVSTEPVRLETPVGHAPQLPYQLWVTYADGRGEYRQVKWMNASEATEQAEANATINPIGTYYKVRGFVVGDNTTVQIR